MSKQLKIDGIDDKCEFCGNLFASDYIYIHINQKCRENPTSHFSNYLRQFTKDGSSQNVKSVIEPKEDKKLIRCEHCNIDIRTERFQKHIKYKCPPLHNPAIKNHKKKTPKKHSQKEKDLVQCKHCDSFLPLDKVQKHLSSKCRYMQTTKGRKQRKRLTIKEREKLAAKKGRQRQRQKAEEELPQPLLETKKIRCSKCGEIYLKDEEKCPECLRIEERNKTLSICSICNIKFSERIFEDHYFKCIQRSVSCSACKRTMRIKTYISHKHCIPINLRDDKEKTNPSSFIKCEHCNVEITQKNYQKHISDKCPKLHKRKSSRKASSRISSLINSKGCRVCGKSTMYNSGHCYSCGDK